jgi:hypothetical protein
MKFVVKQIEATTYSDPANPAQRVFRVRLHRLNPARQTGLLRLQHGHNLADIGVLDRLQQ